VIVSQDGFVGRLRRYVAVASFALTLGLASVGAMIGGATPALAQSGELANVIYMNDIPGFVGEGKADMAIPCLPNQTCLTDDDNVLVGFRQALFPTLRTVDDAPVIESAVQVAATAFGRILLRDGKIVQTFASAAGKVVTVGATAKTAIAVNPINSSWALNNFNGSSAVWITYPGGDSPSNGTTMTASESFSVPVGTTGDVDGFVLADDTASVVLKRVGGAQQTVFDFNPNQDAACAAGAIGCQPDEAGDLSAGNNSPLNLNALPAGDYTLNLTAKQVAGGPFGLQYAFQVSMTPSTVADVCWTFDGGSPGKKVCVSIAECATGHCPTPPAQCPSSGTAKITLTSGSAGDAICDNLAQQFLDNGVTAMLEQFEFVVGLDFPAIANAGAFRVATCTVGGTSYVPLCRDPSSSVAAAKVYNDIAFAAFESPRCPMINGRQYCP
jgi:hypothetical protein